MKSTIQEVFADNIRSEVEAGITFIDERNSSEFLSYKKLYLEACYKLDALHRRGLKEGDELVFQFESNRKFVITFWACVFGKILPVPIAYAAGANTLHKIAGVWKTLKNPYLITDNLTLCDYFEEYRNENDHFQDMLDKLVIYDDLSNARRAKPLASQSGDPVFIQFSSGSTGFPKGVVNTQEAILYTISNKIKNLVVNEEDKFFGWVPLIHDLGLVFFHLLPVLANSPQYLMPPSLFMTYPEFWMESLSRHQITISGGPNFGYKMVLDSLDRLDVDSLKLDQLRMLLNCAEQVSIPVCREFRQVFETRGLPKTSLCPSYGLAEAVLGVSIFVPEDESRQEFLMDRNFLNIGDEIRLVKASDEDAASFANIGIFHFTGVRICNEQGEEVPENTLGIIHLKSPAVTKEFYNNPEVTRQVISADGWLNTGDVGFINQDNLIITGRKKEMILINGKNYFPNDLDTLLEELPEIEFQQVACCNIFNEQTQTDDIYVFVRYKGEIADFVPLMAQIERQISTRLGIPVSKVIAVDKITKTTSGKPQRYMLRKNYLDGAYADFDARLDAYRESVQAEFRKLSFREVESKVLQYVVQIAGDQQVDPATNFFDLGFTSIKTVQLKAALEAEFMVRLDTVVFFKHPNTRKIAEYFYAEVFGHELVTTDPVAAEDDFDAAKARMSKLLQTA